MNTIKIRSFKLHTPEPLLPDTDVDGSERAATATMTTTGDTIIIDPVYVQVFDVPAPDYLDDESFRVDCTANIRNARPAALSIDRVWWVSDGGRLIPFDV